MKAYACNVRQNCFIFCDIQNPTCCNTKRIDGKAEYSRSASNYCQLIIHFLDVSFKARLPQ